MPKSPNTRAGTDYYAKAGWLTGVIYPPQTEEEVLLVQNCGMYHWERNPYGMIRDQVVPKSTGFKYDVFPELLRHPANCVFRTVDESMDNCLLAQEAGCQEIEALFLQIEGYDGDWPEHKLCLRLIERWRKGERYDWRKT